MGSDLARDDGFRPRRQRRAGRRKWKPIVIWAAAASAALIIVVGAWMLFHFSKSRRGDPRLIGTWQSDADATIAEIRKKRPVKAEQEQAMRKLFGKMRITYTDTTFTMEFDGLSDTQDFEVVRKDEDSVVLKARSALTKQEQQFRIRFIGSDTYWVEGEEFALLECFRRIK